MVVPSWIFEKANVTDKVRLRQVAQRGGCGGNFVEVVGVSAVVLYLIACNYVMNVL